MPDRQIFHDPQRKRWKRLRRLIDIGVVVATLVVVGFVFNLVLNQHLPQLLLPVPKHNYRALPDRDVLMRGAKGQRPARRRTNRRPSEIPFNTGEGLRAAYYVQDDAASYSSLKEHVHQIDLLFAQWLHISSPTGNLMGMSADNLHEYQLVTKNSVHDPDEGNRVKNVILAAKEDTEVFPHLNNYNPHTQVWDSSVGDVLKDDSKRNILRKQIVRLFATYPVYRGLSLDIESLDDDANPAYLKFIQDLYSDLHPMNLRLYVNVASQTPESDLKLIAANSDGIVLMNYDEHEANSDPGPVASQTWFIGNLQRVLKVVPK